jgi:hypothetical protein
VDQRGGLQRVAAILAIPSPPCDPVELGVNQRHQTAERLLVSFAPRTQQTRHFARRSIGVVRHD